MMAFRTLRSKCALLAPVCLLVLGAARIAAADTINLGWDASGSTVGYKVHVGVQSGSYTQHFDVGQSTTFAYTSATAGQRYCFAVSAYTLSSLVEGPNSGEVCGYSNAPPTLVNPGNRTSTVGQPTSLQLQGSDPDAQPLSYSATGLPPGLSIMASTGYISGTGTTAGTYSVTARASDGTLSASQSFTWTMTSSSGGGGTTPPPPGPDGTRPVVTIATPTSASTYSVNASSLAMSGTASDNVGVTQVRWENDQMNLRGTANGLNNWTASVPLQVGSNTIYITAVDAAGNEGVDILTVSVSSTGGGTTDTTAPTISIGTPTTGSTYSTTQSTVNLTGSASDNRGVSQVTWTNSAGGSGVASGTTSWSIANLPLQVGTNLITVTSVDAAGNRGTDTLTVTRSGTTTSDATPPTVSIAAPTTGSTYSTTQSTVNVSGSASDNRGVSQVTWTNSAGGSGVASGTTSWSIANIALVAGTNVITVTAVDTAGNRTTDTLTVTRSTTSGGTVPTLRLDSGSQNGWYGVRLYWSQISWSSVDVYRNNVRLKNTENDGSTDDLFTTRGTYTYKVCAPGSTTVCSNSVTAYF